MGHFKSKAMFWLELKTAGGPFKRVAEFIKYGLCQNYWGWFHGLAGAVSGMAARHLGVPADLALLSMLIGAYLWEVYEYFFQLDKMPETVYKTRLRWFYDSLGDIVLAVGMGALALC